MYLILGEPSLLKLPRITANGRLGGRGYSLLAFVCGNLIQAKFQILKLFTVILLKSALTVCISAVAAYSAEGCFPPLFSKKWIFMQFLVCKT